MAMGPTSLEGGDAGIARPDGPDSIQSYSYVDRRWVGPLPQPATVQYDKGRTDSPAGHGPGAHLNALHAAQIAGVAPMPPQQRTILIVNDDHEILESMRTILENKGFRILVARDGNAGLMIAERENPDLIVLDMMMPKKSGFLVLEKLKSRPGGLIPTIMITGNEGSRHRAYAEMLGVRDYIRKPFAMEKLVRAIERVMGVKGPREGFDDEP